MLNDLMKNHLIGISWNQVIELLGKPSQKMDPDGDGLAISYPTGYERKLISIDSEWLLIYFDENKNVKECKIAND